MSSESSDSFAAERLRRQLGATARFTRLALDAKVGLAELLQAACQAACDGSGVGRSKVLLHDPARDDLVIRAGIGWHPGVVGMHVPAHPRTAPGATLRSGKPLLSADLHAEPGLEMHEPLRSHGIVSVANVPIAPNGTVLGVLELDSARPMALHEDDVGFLHGLAGSVAAAIMRMDYEQTALLTEQRLRDNEARLRESRERLRESEERLSVALRAAKMGTWVRYVSANRQVLDDSLRELMGLPPDQAIRTFEEFLAAIHPEDRSAVAEAFEWAIREHADFAVEFRVERPDGSVRWLRDQGSIVADAAGQPEVIAGACVDITERKVAEVKVQRADRTKTEFLAMLAHELRSPMAPLKNAVTLLERSSGDARRTEVALAVMHRQLDHLSRLVGDLLEVSRIEQDKIELRIEPVVLASALTAAIETVQPLIEPRGQRLSVSLPSATMRIPADAVRLTQVVANLLNNAAKFTPDGGAIELVVGEQEHEVAIVVRDNGMGIAPDVLPHIFGLFEQGNNQSLDRAQGGLGIGLALARRLVEMHGGSIAAESEGVGRGAVFTVLLPMASRDAA